MALEYKRILNIYDKYDSYMKSLSWDKDNMYSMDKENGVEWLLQKMIGVYDEDQLIALGCVRTYYKIEKKKYYAELSSIVHNLYRRRGIADHLLKEMLEYCKELNIDIVKVYILEKNIASISQIEKNGFELVLKDNKIRTYQKKLINK